MTLLTYKEESRKKRRKRKYLNENCIISKTFIFIQKYYIIMSLALTYK